MDNVKKRSYVILSQEQLELLRRWYDALEGSKKEVAFDLMNQVMDGKITNEGAFALLDT